MTESSSFLSQLKFRAVQPVDIPRCYQLECLAYPPETAASKSTLQGAQHHAAPFFRCVLLKKSGEGPNKKREVELHALSLLDEGESASERPRRKESDDEACHHVHHSSHSELIGYVYATRCHDVVPAAEFDASAGPNLEEESSKTLETLPYHPFSSKHEANGRYLAIHSIVVQKEYQRLGVAKALLEHYMKSIEMYNADLGEAGLNRRRNQIKAKKPDTGIERIVLMSYSSMANLFLSVGFRWRATVKGGEDPLYELEKEVESPPLSLSVSLPDIQPHPLLEQNCFLVDAFANPRERGSGNPAAIVVLKDSPTNLIADYYNNVDTFQTYIMPKSGETMAMMNIILAAKAFEKDEELADKWAEAWMQSVAREFNQPATAFVWPIETSLEILGRQDSSSISDDELNLSYHEESSNGTDAPSEFHHFIRFYTREGVETDMCAHAALAAASVLFTPCATVITGERRTLSFHSRYDNVLQSSLVSPSLSEEPFHSPSSPPPQALSDENPPPRLSAQITTPCMQSNSTRIAMDCPWMTVDPVPPGSEGQGAVLAMLRRSFFRAWSVVAEGDEDNNDHDTDELAFSLSSDHVMFVGITSGGEHLFIELNVEGFDMISGRAVDYDALRQGFKGCTEGVIICCEVPEALGVDSTSEDVLDGHAEGDGAKDHELPEEDISIDFCSRFFEPTCEDPVSGWPHCALAPYFGLRRGKQRLVGQQSSDRKGLVECILKESEQKVCIIGSAVTTMVGKTMMSA